MFSSIISLNDLTPRSFAGYVSLECKKITKDIISKNVNSIMFIYKRTDCGIRGNPLRSTYPNFKIYEK